MPVDASLSRFSPLTAPERQVVDAFCAEVRPWALRQAKRSYRHLPPHVREQAVDRAMQELRTSAPAAVDRRTLMHDLSESLTQSLRHLHVGWCLNESTARLRRDGVDLRDGFSVAQDGLAEFIDQGLGGFERAVLQLEIGAGRDSRTTRAALRLGPREYGRHRESGLSKLRDAISARVAGRVCEQHLNSVVLAATGDRHAARLLQGGTGRCRACAREAQGLRSVLNERLAVAPWPLVVKPAGVLAAKLGAITAVFGGKSAGGAGAGAVAVSSSGSAGAGAAASVIAVAALVTGATAIVESGPPDTVRAKSSKSAGAHPKRTATHAARAAAKRTVASGARPATRNAARKSAIGKVRTATITPTSAATTRKPTRHTAAEVAPAVKPTVAQSQPQTAPNTNPTLQDTVGGAVGKVNDGVKTVTQKLPPVVRDPVDQTLDGVKGTVDELTGKVDGLLKPKP
jgi:hypothetical protein